MCNPNCRPDRQSGFTLIEIMIVVVIISVMSVAVSLSLTGTSDRTARLQSSRFIAVVNEVRDDAIIRGQNYVLQVSEQSQTYGFILARANTRTLKGDALFKTRHIDSDVKIEWQVFEVLEGDSGVKPKVLISSLGEITPFEMTFAGEKLRFTVFVNDEGQLERRDRQGAR